MMMIWGEEGGLSLARGKESRARGIISEGKYLFSQGLIDSRQTHKRRGVVSSPVARKSITLCAKD